MQSFRKKIKTLLKVGIDPITNGFTNFKNPTKETEKLALERLFDCINCPAFLDEPILFLKVKDKNIPDFSGKFCDECGCTLSYKVRQSISKCDKWQK
jgi:hypothetical protein